MSVEPQESRVLGDGVDGAVLPPDQQRFDVMRLAHHEVRQRTGGAVDNMNLVQLQALRTQVTWREQELLTTQSVEELFDSAQQHSGPADIGLSENVVSDGLPALTLTEYAQVRAENARLAEVLCVRTTAEAVKEVQRSGTASGASQPGRTGATLRKAIAAVAQALQLTYSVVDRRLSLAATLWPSAGYRRTRVKLPGVAESLRSGRISCSAAGTAHDRLQQIRQAVRRAGGESEAADELVAHQEKEFTYHAQRNNPHIFSRFAKSRTDAITNTFVGPKRPLTQDQTKYERGIFYEGSVGDTLHRLSVVVNDAELLRLNALREFATTLSSKTATMRAHAHRVEQDPSAGDLDNDQRITDEDLDLGIATLFDGQTQAERWLNTLFDFLSGGLILHKTYDPLASADSQRCQLSALHKAAEYSEVLADILNLDPPDAADADIEADTDGLSAPPKQSQQVPSVLSPFVPPGYQLLRPNLDLIVQIQLDDLMELPHSKPVSPDSASSSLGLSRGREYTMHQPLGSPGHVPVNPGLARLQACSQRVLPIVLGSASQPLDVGRAQRSFSTAIRRALHVRDQGCVVPGCTRPAPWCEPHHLLPWSQGGETSLDNGALLCRSHHTAVHQGELSVHMEDDGLPSCSLPAAVDPSRQRYRNIFWNSAASKHPDFADAAS